MGETCDQPTGGGTPCRSGAGLVPLLGALGEPAGTRLLAVLERSLLAVDVPATSPAGMSGECTSDRVREDDLAIIDREVARLFAVRELYLAWVQEARAEGARGTTPAQFLRAWSESTGRVLQLLRARRDLSTRGGGDALLDAVYEELERRLPDPGAPLPGTAAERVGGTCPSQPGVADAASAEEET